MTTKTKTKTTNRLTLTRETLRTLTTDELRLVNGGARVSKSNGPDC